MEGLIDITDVDMVKFVTAVYDLSRPQGLGFLHAVPGSLPEAEAKELAAFFLETDRLDYVKGRSCKMTLYRENGRMYIHPDWYDHSYEDMNDLLKAVGLQR